MVWYKYPQFLQHFTGTGNAYDVVYNPGQVVPHSGIYRCESCGGEIICETGRTFPPTHANAAAGHPVRWRLAGYPNPPPTTPK
jgi:hypothetical protein